MFGLRQKLIFGLGGLLVILFLVGGLSVAVMHQFSTDLNTFLTENWRSVQYGQAMINDLEQLDDMAKAPTADASRFIQDFDLNVDAENNNITLHPQEDELAAKLTRQWRGIDLKTGAKVAGECYRDEYLSLLNKPSAAAYSAIVDFSPKVKATAQAIINLNLDNMTPLQGHVKDLRDQAVRLMLLLAAAGTALAAGFTIILGRSILQPLGTLTRSFREIEQGNLDLVVQVRTRDELRELAEAFNSMAAKLREFRRTDRAKLVRTQRTTQLAVNSLPDAIAIINPDGIIELANDAARNLFQLTPGQSMTAMTDPRLPELYRWVSRERRPSPVQGYESSLEVGDATGQVRYFLPHAVPILDADGKTAPEERRLVGTHWCWGT
jgi:two-component system, NtrC family, sensor histidine kinase KinB